MQEGARLSGWAGLTQAGGGNDPPPQMSKWTLIWAGGGVLDSIGGGDNDPDSLGMGESTDFGRDLSDSRPWDTTPASRSGNAARARPWALPPVPRPAGGGSGADGLLAAAAAAARLSALLADGPPALRARGSPLPAACSPVPWARGEAPPDLLPGSRLPPSRPPHPAGRAGRPPEGEGEGTSALFVTTESIVCEEPAPAGDRAERGAGGPDGGGARRG